MAHQENLFSEFPQVKKSEWLAKIEKDLKGRAYDELSWVITPELSLPPVFNIEDREEEIAISSNDNSWEIGEKIQAEQPGAANKLALEALQKGANAIQFELPQTPELPSLLKDILPEYISLHFALPPTSSLSSFWEELKTELPADGETLKGSVYKYGEPSSKQIQETAQLVAATQHQLPGFRMIHIEVENLDNPVQSLTNSLLQANQYLELLSDQGLPIAYLASRMQFSIDCGSTYFLEIARIRALRILAANLLEAYGLSDMLPPIEATTSLKAYQEDSNTNMIIASSIAMSAVIGGVDRLYVSPANSATESPSAFTRRVARNLQHILQMESYLDRVADPAAGSYYLDHLSKELVEKSWEQFCEKVSS